jgi:hypothetical protein
MSRFVAIAWAKPRVNTVVVCIIAVIAYGITNENVTQNDVNSKKQQNAHAHLFGCAKRFKRNTKCHLVTFQIKFRFNIFTTA